MNNPILSITIFIPLVAGLLMLVYPQDKKQWVRWTALAAAAVTFILTLVVYFSYNVAQGGYQFIQEWAWLPQLGIAYKVGVDGISAPLFLMAGVVLFCGTAISWNVEDRTREFYAFLMFLGTSVLGVFVSLDAFLLFFFFELAIFPKYLMIVIWGYPKTREYGAMKLTLYLFIGSVFALVGLLAMVFLSGANTFDMIKLQNFGFPMAFQQLWFPFVFFGFAVLAGIFPFHSWAPDGHVAAPTAVSMMLAGVEMKVGAFAALRVGIMLMPDGARFWSPLILVLATINVVYGAVIALVQTDFKYVIGFSSVSHMGLVLIGFATLSPQGLLGSGLQMFSHGVMTALFFSVVGMVYDRAHTRDIPKLGGLFQKMPFAAVAFIVAGLVSMGMPLFSGFIAEFPIFMGAWSVAPIVAIIAILGVIVTAGYILVVVRKVFFGEPSPETANVGDVSVLDKVAMSVLVVIMIALGVFPSLMYPWIQSGVKSILALVGGA